MLRSPDIQISRYPQILRFRGFGGGLVKHQNVTLRELFRTGSFRGSNGSSFGTLFSHPLWKGAIPHIPISLRRAYQPLTELLGRVLAAVQMEAQIGVQMGSERG